MAAILDFGLLCVHRVKARRPQAARAAEFTERPADQSDCWTTSSTLSIETPPRDAEFEIGVVSVNPSAIGEWINNQISFWNQGC